MANAPYLKKFSTHAEQIALLEQRGMVVADHAKAEACLARIGYYRLSAYMYPFRLLGQENGKTVVRDQFYGRPDFDDVVGFYIFDKNLRIMVSDALERIEVALRAEIAHRLGAVDPLAHRNAARLDGKFSIGMSRRTGRKHLTLHQDWLDSQDGNFQRSKEDFAKHFRKKYSGHPPIWIATEAWDWGALSNFYPGMKAADRNAIAAKYGTLTSPEMEAWIHAMNDVRNVCAHHSRLWNRGLKVTLKWPAVGVMPLLDHINGSTHSLSRLYGVLLAMVTIMKVLHPATEWHKRMRDFILQSAPSNPVIDCSKAGFPNGWEKEGIWR